MFEAKRFLTDKFGSAGGVVALLGAYGADVPNRAAVDKWFQRGSIPADWLAVLLAFLEIEDGPVSMINYVRRTT